jgi:hypothetical protein
MDSGSTIRRSGLCLSFLALKAGPWPKVAVDAAISEVRRASVLSIA